MTKKELLQLLPQELASIVDDIDKAILASDKVVIAEVSPIMNSPSAIVYKESGVFKYGIAVHGLGLTIHSMPMYAHPQLRDMISHSTDIKMQKGCFNVKKPENIDLSVIENFFKECAKADFKVVLDRYKR